MNSDGAASVTGRYYYLWWRTMTALVDVERAVRAAASGPDSPPPPPPPNAPKPP